ncbi:MAG: thioredoxin domain-containing protein [Candidatus Delongbacteria bacterium]|nr:thioredoxin domain-containing protein [Candidatus Delongbacteria bacterium]MBN2835622.1 thioredoxin domain-containing protein [Candidatus Delongbacteria bacterium]
MNNLQFESSPYLKQHSRNPVNWYAWNDKTIELIKTAMKPVFLSIGYSTCHWCHVMEKESFEDQTTANYLNKYFISIKIDREELPHIDKIYMDFVQANYGNGGWPLNVFLTEDLIPFFGGTYFPKERRYGMPTFVEILERIYRFWSEQKESLNEIKQQYLTNSPGLKFSIDEKSAIEKKAIFESAFLSSEKRYDKKYGGFSGKPKFLHTFEINFLLESSEPKYHQMALHSLKSICFGGIYDQLGGGVCRYSTDEKWIVPHFEKMMYDNALLLRTLSKALKINKDSWIDFYFNKTLQFILSMEDPETGLFYTAMDADTSDGEGYYYTWSKSEIESLNTELTDKLIEYFDITESGNFEGRNILTVMRFDDSFYNTNIEILDKLIGIRDKREKPSIDDKIMLDINSLIIWSLFEAVTSKFDIKLLDLAIEKTDKILDYFYSSDKLYRTKDRIQALQTDYSYLIRILLYVYNFTSKINYLSIAEKLFKEMSIKFKAEKGLFFENELGQNCAIIRNMEIYDGVVPSGNSVAYTCSHELFRLTGNVNYIEQCQDMEKFLDNLSLKYPEMTYEYIGFVNTSNLNNIKISGIVKSARFKTLIDVYTNYNIIPEFIDEKEFYILICNEKGCSPKLYNFNSIKGYL